MSISPRLRLCLNQFISQLLFLSGFLLANYRIFQYRLPSLEIELEQVLRRKIKGLETEVKVRLQQMENVSKLLWRRIPDHNFALVTQQAIVRCALSTIELFLAGGRKNSRARDADECSGVF